MDALVHGDDATVEGVAYGFGAERETGAVEDVEDDSGMAFLEVEPEVLDGGAEGGGVVAVKDVNRTIKWYETLAQVDIIDEMEREKR